LVPSGLPIVSLRTRFVCALLSALLAVGAAAGASEASKHGALLAAALEIPVSDVLDAAEIEMDGAVRGAFGRCRHDGREIAVVVSVDGGPAAWLGPADEVRFGGLVDLRASTPVPRGRRTARRLRTAGLGRPALALLTRYEESTDPSSKPGLLRPGQPGMREGTHLFLVELDPSLRVLLSLEIRHRSGDGFGGHDVGGLALRQQDGTTYLEGVRQDHLPASRARCKQPAPYPVRYELDGIRFRELSPERRQAPCGGVR
jgi:hypothetical protein